MLSIQNIDVFYGNIQALRGISLEVSKGEIVSLIGANGAGKSTTLKAISGLIHPKNGKIEFEGEDITNKPAQEIVKRRISQVPEGRRVFAQMTVYENLELGATCARIRKASRIVFSGCLTVFQYSRKALSKGRYLGRRGTADAGYGQGSYVPAETSSP